MLKKVNVIERSSKAGVVFWIDVVRLKFDSIVCVKGDFVRYLKYEGHCEVGEGKDEERFLKNSFLSARFLCESGKRRTTI